MKKFIAVALLIISSAAASANAPVDPNAWINAQPSVEIAVSHGSAADMYNVSAKISDLRTGQILAEPKLIASAEKPAEVQAGAIGMPGMITVELTVTVADSGDVAAYTSRIKDNGVIISSQSATLAVTR